MGHARLQMIEKANRYARKTFWPKDDSAPMSCYSSSCRTPLLSPRCHRLEMASLLVVVVVILEVGMTAGGAVKGILIGF